MKDNGDGTYTVGYTPTEDGPHKVDVKYDGDSIPGTPKDVNVLPKTDIGKVKAYGPGLESALTGQKAQFTVDTKEAGIVIVIIMIFIVIIIIMVVKIIIMVNIIIIIIHNHHNHGHESNNKLY